MADLSKHGLLVVMALVVAACPDDDDDGGSSLQGTEVGCEWFTGDNCWKETVASADQCATPSEETGVLDGAATRCTFADGTEVVFGEPVPSGEAPDDYPVSFTIHKQGSECVSLLSDQSGITVTTADGTFQERVVGFAAELTCPDGSMFHSTATVMLDCGLGNLPGLIYSVGNGRATVSLMGGEEPLFKCESQ